MTFSRLLQYLGLQREPGVERTATSRTMTVVWMVVVFAALSVTRDLKFWPQIAVASIISVVFGILFAVVLTAVDRSRRRTGT